MLCKEVYVDWAACYVKIKSICGLGGLLCQVLVYTWTGRTAMSRYSLYVNWEACCVKIKSKRGLGGLLC
jgi:hypothetical protein